MADSTLENAKSDYFSVLFQSSKVSVKPVYMILGQMLACVFIIMNKSQEKKGELMTEPDQTEPEPEQSIVIGVSFSVLNKSSGQK